MNNEDNQLIQILTQLKTPGAVLIKQKLNGNQYSRQFFLHEHEGYISYRKSQKIFRKPRTCKLKKNNIFRNYRLI